MSVGDWLNSVIARNDEEDFTDDEGPAKRLHNVSQPPGDRADSEARVRRRGGPYRDESRDERERRPPHPEGRPRRNREGGEEREATGDYEENFTDDKRLAERLRNVSRRLGDRPDSEAPVRHRGGPYVDERERPPPHPEDRPRRNQEREEEREEKLQAARDAARNREQFDEVNARLDRLSQHIERGEERVATRDAARSREHFDEVHARLDRLSQQLECLSERPDGRPTGAPPRRRPDTRPTGARPQRRPNAAEPPLSIEAAVAEIAARQHALDGEPVAAVAEIAARQRVLDGEPVAPVAEIATRQHALDGEAVAPVAENTARPPAFDFSDLEKQLQQITARIEALQPTGDIEKAIGSIRTDLADIGRQLNEALPRRAVESLEIEVKALGERIDHSRQSGVDPTALAGLERGLTEVREALHRLTPAENLVGFDQAVSALAQKVDLILARDDPAARQQLEAAIGGLHGIVSHVASNDTLTRVAEEVRALAAQVDGIANNAATGQAVSSLEQRIDTLAAALNASSEAGHAVPRDLETLLAGLIEKLEWVQLTHTDHAALAHLEDRIATLVKRFDASDARLGHLEAIERGLADLLVHIEQMRGVNGGAAAATRLAPAAHSIEHDVAEIKQSDRRTQDSLEAVQGTVEQVVDRLAMIESDLHRDETPPATEPALSQPLPDPAEPAVPAVEEPPEPVAVAPPQPIQPTQPTPSRAPAARPPIDPTLPPDHPLEPGSAAVRSRPMPSAADRVAASEAAIGSSKPPVIADSGRPDFIAAARRAAQAAAWEPSRKEEKEQPPEAAPGPSKLSQRLRKLIVAGSAVLILVGGLRIATRLFDDSGPAPSPSTSPQTQTGQTPPPAKAAPQATVPAAPSSPEALPLPQPKPAPDASPSGAPATKETKPGRQSMLPGGNSELFAASATPQATTEPISTSLPSWAVPDITGALPGPQPAPRLASTPEQPAGVAEDKLPPTIGNAALRKAALAGDPAAEYEVASRFAEGRGVLQNNQEAAYWLQRAAKQGLAPAQFRLGGLYEKGIGVKKNLAAARDLYLAAAEKGNGKAMHNLAVLYAEGFDGTPDYNKAVDWFRQAANHGIRDSEYNLGILYARGIGVQHSDAESYKWFALAADQGDAEAAKKRDEIAALLDPQSLAAARLAVKNWSPEPQPDDAINVRVSADWEPPASNPRAAKSK
jgi:localization factor PodJL